VLEPAAEFTHLTPGPVVFLTFLGTLGAVGVYTLLRRRSQRPDWLFQRIAWGALALSFLPDVALGMSNAPGVTWPNIVGLMLLHVVAFSVVMLVLVERQPTAPSNPTDAQ
jgi:hypothetical protein